MRAPVSWLAEYVDGAPVATGREVAASLVRVGLEEEGLHGGDITGPLVVGRVLEFVEEPQKNGKTIRWCQVDVGQNGQRVTEGTPQGIVCGATNFADDDPSSSCFPELCCPVTSPSQRERPTGTSATG
jgi:phenylalanyl-tRNA synthetase beta chain